MKLIQAAMRWQLASCSTSSFMFQCLAIFPIAHTLVKMFLQSWLLHAAILITACAALLQPPGVQLPLATHCGPSSANIVCIERYGAVMPYHFFREPDINNTDIAYGDTSVPNDPSFGLVKNATFLVFDHQRGLEILGPTPTYELMFNVTEDVHEAPVYVPRLNKLFVSRLSPGYLPQLVIDLNQNPPTIVEYLSDPPVYAPNGGTLHNGLIYWVTGGGNSSLPGGEQRPGIRTLNPETNESITLLNNYFGYYFNGLDDVSISPVDGGIWFTDPDYAWFRRRSDTPPELKAASYRFDPGTGNVRMVEDSVVQPNGIVLTPDGKTAYIADSGVLDGSIVEGGPEGTVYNQTGERTIYKFDVVDNGTSLCCKRPFWYAEDWLPDGIKVARNGMVVAATGRGVDVLDGMGVLILRIETSFIVQNFAWVGEELKEFWLVGTGGIARVRWQLEGVKLE